MHDQSDNKKAKDLALEVKGFSNQRCYLQKAPSRRTQSERYGIQVREREDAPRFQNQANLITYQDITSLKDLSVMKLNHCSFARSTSAASSTARTSAPTTTLEAKKRFGHVIYQESGLPIIDYFHHFTSYCVWELEARESHLIILPSWKSLQTTQYSPRQKKSSPRRATRFDKIRKPFFTSIRTSPISNAGFGQTPGSFETSPFNASFGQTSYGPNATPAPSNAAFGQTPGSFGKRPVLHHNYYLHWGIFKHYSTWSSSKTHHSRAIEEQEENGQTLQ